MVSIVTHEQKLDYDDDGHDHDDDDDLATPC